jgi:aspartate 1-decarboxylase
MDIDLLEAADILEHELVHVLDIANGTGSRPTRSPGPAGRAT